MLNSLPASFSGRPATPTQPQGSRVRTISFSFDWARGQDDKKGESLSYLSQWRTYGEGLPHLRTSHWRHFVVLLVCSGIMFSLAGLFLPLVLIRPQKVCGTHFHTTLRPR